MKSRWVRFRSCILLFSVLVRAVHAQPAEPSDRWLLHYGIPRWQILFDHDDDGYATVQEFAAGTDPMDPQSRPFRHASTDTGVSLEIAFTPGIVSELLTSVDLVTWEPVTERPASGTWLHVAIDPAEHQRYFTLAPLRHLNSDEDCLLDFEEITLYGTDPFNADTDGDGLDDCAEVTLHFTDPTFRSPSGRGAIHGRVVLDEDGDPDTREHPPARNWTVFIDLNFDGRLDPGEPRRITGSDGSFEFNELDPGWYRVRLEQQPGWTQVFPSTSPPATPDGYADRVVHFHDSGTGPIPGPYGKKADPLPGVRVVLGLEPEPVDTSIVLGAPPPAPITAPISAFSHVDWLSLPLDSEITVAFDGEEIFDGPGPDLVIHTEGRLEETAELHLGPTESNLVFTTVFASDSNILIDLAEFAITEPVRFVRIKALDLLGSFPGIEIVGYEALHYRPLPRGHHDVAVVGGMTSTGADFGVAGDDRPPRAFISLDHESPRAGEPTRVTLTASDDVGITTASLFRDGGGVPLDADSSAILTPASGGLLQLAATVTDTAGQTAETSLSVVVRNPDGSRPDLSGHSLTEPAPADAPVIRVNSPVAGEILEAEHTLVASITGSGQAAVAGWRVDYARAGLVDPENLAADDPDYVPLAAGTGPVTNGALAIIPADALPAGDYLLRLTASSPNGTTAWHGFVIGVRVDPLDIRPGIQLTSPAGESIVTFIAEIRGTIATRQTLRNWYVEYAPLSELELANLTDPSVEWTRIADGTEPVEDDVIARFDPTLIPNDTYVLRISAWNRNGLGWAEPLILHVAGNAKPGSFTLERTDLLLPLAGIPIEIRRIYESIDAPRRRDFGHGWRLAFAEADIRETVPQTGSGFRSTPFRVGTRIYLNAPDGSRAAFTFNPVIGANSLIGAAWRAVFTPDPGVRHTLTTPEGDSPFLTIDEAGRAALFFIGQPWNPDVYLLTTPEGVTYTYHQDDGLREITDRNGNRVTFSPNTIEHSSGPRIDLLRDDSGRITGIRAPDDVSVSYSYDENGDLTEVTRPGDITTRYGYSSEPPHLLERIEDPENPGLRRIEYDEAGRVAAFTDAAGHHVEQHWDPETFTGTRTDARGNVTRLTYDQRGNLVRTEDPLGGVTTWEYANPAFPDLETAITDPRGNRTTFSHDARGNLLSISRPVRGTGMSYTYDDEDRVTVFGYGTGGREFATYDDRGNLTGFRSSRGDWTFTYTSDGLLASAISEDGGLTRLEYTGASPIPSRIIDPNGAVREFMHDAYGRVIEVIDPLGHSTRFEYDAAGRVTRQVLPSGDAIAFTYDTRFTLQPAAITDPAGRVTRYEYDSAGRISAITDNNDATTRYEYDPDGNPTAVVDPLGFRTEFQYDALGRLTRETDPAGNSRSFQWDAAGNLVEFIDRNGRKRTFAHDTINRRTAEFWHDPDSDEVIRTIDYEYSGLNQLTRAADPDADVRLAYLPTPDRSPGTVRIDYPGRPQMIQGYDHDAAGRLTSFNILGTLTFRATRDLAGHLRILTADAGGTNRWRLELWRNARGDVTELRRFSDQNGVNPAGSTTFQRDACACWITGIQHHDRQGQPITGAAMSFAREPDGAITEITDGSDTLTYAQDDVAQLAAVARNGAPVESYVHDANGNRVSTHLDASHTHGPGNRLTRTSRLELGYDPEGNVVSRLNPLTGDLLTYSWDHRNRLTRVVAAIGDAVPVTTEYRYDGLDRRIAIIRAGHTNWVYHDGEHPVAEYLDDEATPAAVYFHGEGIDDLHVVQIRDLGFFWIQTDHLKSVRRVLDAGGSEVAAFRYDSYGNLLAASGGMPEAAGPFRFAGREWDPATRLYYNRARYYDPEIGRFISADPIGFWSGEINLYRYAMNQPHRFTDPTGLGPAIEYRPLLTPVVGFHVGFGLQIACNAWMGNPLLDGAVGAGAFGAALGSAAHFGLVRVLGGYQPVAAALPLPIATTLLKLKGGGCDLPSAISGGQSLGRSAADALGDALGSP